MTNKATTTSKKKNIEAIYPLTPLQEGMLFHAIMDPHSGVYFEQMSVTFRGKVNEDAFRKAWQFIIDRHQILRTAFVYRKVEKPVQVVHRTVPLPLQVLDWRDRSPEEQEKELARFLEEDRRRGFKLNQAPLMRFYLIYLDDDRVEFVWSQHHLTMDGWSRPILLKEVFAAYDAFSQGQTPQLPPVRPYKQYIQWLKRQDEKAAEQFWKELLHGFTAPTPLNIDAIPGDEKGRRDYDRVAVSLSAGLSSAVEQLARENQITVNTILQSAWALLLSYYAGQDDVVFGATVSGRPPEIPGVEEMVGMFINTLPVRVRIRPGQSVRQWLAENQALMVKMRQFEYTPLVKVQNWSDVPAGTPLFDSIFVFENYPVDRAMNERQMALDVESVKTHARTNFPLTIVAAPGENIHLLVAFDATRFGRQTIERLLSHLENILRGFVEDPDQPVVRIPIVSAEEQQTILSTLTGKTVSLPEGETIVSRFEQIVAEHAGATAAVFHHPDGKTTTITYGELNRAANRLAHHLKDLGVAKETLVGVCVPRSIDTLIAILGVLKAGGGYLPLDPIYPAERIQYMLNDSGVQIVIAHAQSRHLLGDFTGHVVEIGGKEDPAADAPDVNPETAVNPSDLAYVIYTSGSTGKPKGTVLAHRGVVNLIHFVRDYFAVQPGTNALQFASYSFDGSVIEIFGALLNGATLHIVPRDVILNVEHMADLIENIPIHWGTFPPSYWQTLPPRKFPDFRHAISAGEACSIPVAQRWAPGRHFVNGYGPTEATVGCSFYDVDAERVEQLQTVPIGKPHWNTYLRVLDRHGRLCAIGVPGELHVGGVQLARGYLNRPELTAEKFVPDPFDEQGQARVYRTGDIARLLPDGNLEYVGRLDFQVKIRGFRVELGEIENLLQQHPDVQDAVVVLRKVNENSLLVGYFIPKEGASVTPQALRTYLEKQLPDYMVPAAFVPMDQFPLTENGKVARDRLPEPQSEHIFRKEFVPPRNPVEEVVAEIFKDLLNVPRVSVLDDFFELGGHSLLATRLLSRLKEAFDLDVPLRDIFEHSTVEGIARQVEILLRREAQVEMPPIQRVERRDHMPLSFAQQRLWFLDQLAKGTALYNIPIALRLKGQLNISALENSLNEIIRRHETLRTTFSEVNGEPVQIIHPFEPIELPVEDLSVFPPDERLDVARKKATQEGLTPFDLENGPLFRVRLLKLDETDYAIIGCVHHIIADGWSVGVLIEELGKLYAAAVNQTEPDLPELDIQYVDYAVWQQQFLQGETLERHVAFWKEALADAPQVLELPTDKPRPPVQSYHGQTLRRELPAELTQAVHQFSRKRGVTPYMTLLAAFQTLLHRYSGQDDVLVGTPVANRNLREVEKLIGFFVNTLVLRARFTPQMNFKELIRQVRETTLNAFAHQELPFEKLVEVLQPERNLTHSPIFQVAFVFQNRMDAGLQLPELVLEPFEYEARIAKYDLTLTVSETDDALFTFWEYNTDLFTEATIRRMMSHFETLLKEALAQPDVPVARLPLLSDEERHRMLVEWNATRKPFDESLCVHQKFEQVAATHPQAIAVELDDQRLTYQELNARANQLAHYLRKQGVGPEVLVGISMDRSIEMVVSMLGVLKAGGAFVPIDPTYPPERVQYMIEDSGIPVLLTQKMVREFLTVPDRVQVIAVDEAWETIAQEPTENPENVTVPENLAYVIYTSGSTGRPKGTLLAHRGLINLAQAQQEAFHITPESRVLQFAALSFDASVWEFVMALLNGATLVLAHREQLVTGQGLEEVLRTKEISIVTLPPSVLAVMPESELPALRTIVLAGEKVTGDLVEKWGKGRQFVDAYGPTETTVCASMHVCEGSYPMGPPIGRGINNFELYVLDEHLELVPVGVPGELYIGGPGLARGYLGRPDLTAERFVPHPFSRVGGERLYRTGDLVRWLPQGELEFLGRVDFQVKVRGFRIELGEIEAVLSEHPHIADAAVVAVEDGKGNKRLVGYIVPTGEINIGEVKEYLRKKLPDYMVPSVLMVLEEMPLTPSGKVDRRRLPKPSVDREALGTEYVAPRNETEEKLAAIVGELLEIEKVGVYDNFFDLGGHSLLATRFLSRIREEFGVEVPLRSLFERPTISGLAEVILSGGVKSEEDTIERVERGDSDLSDLLDELL